MAESSTPPWSVRGPACPACPVLWGQCAERREAAGTERSGRKPCGRWTWWTACGWRGRSGFWARWGSRGRTWGRGGRWRRRWWIFLPSDAASNPETRRTTWMPEAAGSLVEQQTKTSERRKKTVLIWFYLKKNLQLFKRLILGKDLQLKTFGVNPVQDGCHSQTMAACQSVLQILTKIYCVVPFTTYFEWDI